MQGMMGGRPGANPFGGMQGGRGGKNADAQLKAAMEMLNKMQKR
jgi:hypothetical protein